MHALGVAIEMKDGGRIRVDKVNLGATSEGRDLVLEVLEKEMS